MTLGNHEAKRAGIGEPVRRKEDIRFVSGEGAFGDTWIADRQAYALMLRSPHAHAKILSVNCEEALLKQGVLAVLTGADAAKDGMKPIPHLFRTPAHPPDVRLNFEPGHEPYISPHFPLAADKVRFVGEIVAVVVAESIDLAKDAAELVTVDYDVLPAEIDAEAACRPDAALIWEDASTNVCLDGEIGDRELTEAAFQVAAHTVKIRSVVPRVTGAPMEPRTALAVYHPSKDSYELFAGSSGAVRLKIEIAEVLGIKPQSLRVVSGDVGGNFGTRNSVYPEYPLVLWAAKRVDRPIKWVCERTEAFLSDYQGRDMITEAELALDKDGRFLALKGSIISNIGAHTVSYVAIVKSAGMMSSVYRIPTCYVRARGVLTNTAPTHPLRSTGRPEAMLAVESLIDLAASEFGFDRLRLRRLNLLSKKEMPYTNPFGLTYDSGDYKSCMERALLLADFTGFKKRKAVSRKAGLCRGIGVSNYIEVCTGATRERVRIRLLANGVVELVVGTQSSGQGHETAFAQLLVEWLGIPFESIKVVMGDTEIVDYGGGSHSGRSMRMIGIVVKPACEEIIRKGKLLVAQYVGVPEQDVEFRQGYFTTSSSNLSVHLLELPELAAKVGAPFNGEDALTTFGDETTPIAGFPYGCHVCEVEIDPQTGSLRLLNYVAVDDVGKAINPMILHGQTHGGIAHGVGQALMERCMYDQDAGEVMIGSLMDYALPRAGDLPLLTTELSEVPSPTNALGVRSGGEGGTTPALAVVSNAVTDALAHLGVGRVALPITSANIWEAIRSAQEQRKEMVS